MIECVDFFQPKKWCSLLQTFSEIDIYYTYEYCRAFQLHGDGIPLLIYFISEHNRAINVVFKRHIPSTLTKEYDFYDFRTPYGYGGFLFESPPSHTELDQLEEEYINFCMKNNIVSEFMRCHPILKNAQYLSTLYKITDCGITVTMDISDKDTIWKNITSKNRNVIRKAQKAGIEISQENTWEGYREFIAMYTLTMKRDLANNYYFFSDKFFESIFKDLKYNARLFSAKLRNKTVAMSIILTYGSQMHYHLSASLKEYQNFAPTNLLLYEVANWGCENSYKTFHLGGGIGGKKDNLYNFKKSFNRNSPTTFSVGKKVFMQDIYDKLVSFRQQQQEINMESTFFPLYRL